MFFSGDFKSKRNINLGGHSDRKDRQTLLNQAKMEREHREQERLRRANAFKIQVFYRSRKAAKRHFDSQRALWDSTYLSNSAIIGPDSFLALTTQLLSFYSTGKDFERLLHASQILASNAGGKNLWTIVQGQGAEKQARWTRSLKNILVICLDELLARMNSPPGPTHQLVASLLSGYSSFDAKMTERIYSCMGIFIGQHVRIIYSVLEF